ncbi:hypothetical protein ABZ951_00470 [Streptomyces sp. NPDC046215]|uniref:Phage tail assembly chaperone n=1 Tax=Streptomyces stramineus TaxID=173861 RepID=A0ABN0ZP47_9ACTN
MAPRTATDDQPFDFNLDAVKAEVDLTPWRVHWNGRRWEFAHMQSLDVWALMEAAEGGDTQAMTGIFRAALGDEAWAEFRKVKLPQYKLKALFDGYRRHSGLEPGESAASAS